MRERANRFRPVGPICHHLAPYANNYDYADATRLEMTFFGEVEGGGGLQETVRRHWFARVRSTWRR